jgi:purine-binding chemotaxis protein CheW
MNTPGDAALTMTKQYLSFSVADTDYGLPILKVKEILQYEELTWVPGTPLSVRGVLNVRGAVVPVADLAVKFGLPPTTPTKLTCVLVIEAVVEGEPLTFGVLADAVNAVVDLGDDQVEPPPSFGPQVAVSYLVGMGKLDQRFVLLLDIDRVLSAPEMDVAAQLAAAVTVEEPVPAPEVGAQA